MTLESSAVIMQLAGLGGMEWLIVIGLIVAVFFGAKKIPEFARSFGKASGEYNKAKLEATKELNALKNGLSPSSSTSSDRTRLQDIAETLGISTENKTDEEVRSAIQGELNRQTGRATNSKGI